MLLLILTDMSADTQGQVGLPFDVVLPQQAFTHILFIYLDAMRLGRNAQYVRHAITTFGVDC